MATKKNETTALGADEVQAKSDAETDVGYSGIKVDPVPNEEYTLATGPTSPSFITDSTSAVAQHSVLKEV